MSGPATAPSPEPANWVGWGLFLAALVVVLGVWGVRQLPNSVSILQAGLSSPPYGEVPGFRSDALFLPDEALLGFVQIPGGPFLMGSDRSADPLAYENEGWVGGGGPALVEIPTYYIGRYEVTVAQFRAFVEATGHRTDPGAFDAPPDHPATLVSWPDALAYARWIEGALRESPQTPPELARLLEAGWRVTLPTEAQWEKAARGPDGRIYPWGDGPRVDRANFQGGGTLPVGSFECPECPYGLADMSGNVWEWTREAYQAGPYDPEEDRVDLTADPLWVMRGGSFGDGPQLVRAAVRGGAEPGARRPFIGFRLVLAPP